MYTPDNWILLKIQDPKINKIIYKVLGGWSGGYSTGDSWRINSGITTVSEEKEYYLFGGHSGSIYQCYRDSETLRMNTAGIFAQLKEQYTAQIEQIYYKEFIQEFAEFHTKICRK